METQQVAKNSNPSSESGVPHVQSTSGNAHDGTSSDFECGGGRPLVALADARCLMRHVSTTESSLLHCSETTLPCQRWIIEQNIVAQKSTSWHTVGTWMFPFCANAARHNVAICGSPPLLFNVPDMSVAIPLMFFPYVSGGTTVFHSAGECRREGIDRVGTVRREDRILRNWKETNPKYCGMVGFLKGWQVKSVAGSLRMCI